MNEHEEFASFYPAKFVFTQHKIEQDSMFGYVYYTTFKKQDLVLMLRSGFVELVKEIMMDRWMWLREQVRNCLVTAPTKRETLR